MEIKQLVKNIVSRDSNIQSIELKHNLEYTRKAKDILSKYTIIIRFLDQALSNFSLVAYDKKTMINYLKDIENGTIKYNNNKSKGE